MQKYSHFLGLAFCLIYPKSQRFRIRADTAQQIIRSGISSTRNGSANSRSAQLFRNVQWNLSLEISGKQWQTARYRGFVQGTFYAYQAWDLWRQVSLSFANTVFSLELLNGSRKGRLRSIRVLTLDGIKGQSRIESLLSLWSNNVNKSLLLRSGNFHRSSPF